ncbi:MAG: AmmeMemoRadiSam system radical SAM enzyme [Kiritimatiellae bacterium]|nr:AmmeMemoRadiSam system radical SAM enzyme [Kiritimatiellia bacterium]
MNDRARYDRLLSDGRVQCVLCPRECVLKEGQRGVCFVRQARGGELILTTYGRSSGFAVDPIEKKPLNHFLPGTAILSFGTAGCNLQCCFCQNWNLSRSREMDTMGERASPERIAAMAKEVGCRSVAFTYNDPVIFAEYAIDTAQTCHTRGIKTVAVTAGYIQGEARNDFFAEMDAANIDLKAFTERFYKELCGASLAPVLETIEYAVRETACHVELTTLLIPGENDGEAEIDAMTRWIMEKLGPDVPLHFTAFHPAHRLQDHVMTPLNTLRRARTLAMRNGLRYVYTGNVRDREGATTFCHHCHAPLIVRDGYELIGWSLDAAGACTACGTPCAGVFNPPMVIGDRLA